MSSFRFDTIDNALDIDRLFKREFNVQAQLAELDAVQELLATPAWTAVDVQPHSTLRLAIAELFSRRLVGRNRAASAPSLHESPFWCCVQEAKIHAYVSLEQHNDTVRMQQHRTVAMANANTGFFGAVPGGDQQVQVAFPLVTLLYATFSVPLPRQGTTPLWPALITTDVDGESMPTFACLDLTARADGRLNDVYDLKPNLRRGVFLLSHPDQPRPLVPWLGVLRMLVGYTKYVQSLVAPAPPFQALDEMSRLLALESERLQQELQDLIAQRTDETVQWLKDSEVPEPSASVTDMLDKFKRLNT
jgi:hypothetical protein